MERHPYDQPEQYDRRGDLNPNYAAKLSQHHLDPRTPLLAHLISDCFDRVRHEPEPRSDPLGMMVSPSLGSRMSIMRRTTRHPEKMGPANERDLVGAAPKRRDKVLCGIISERWKPSR